jgi:hypothetical protein
MDAGQSVTRAVRYVIDACRADRVVSWWCAASTVILIALIVAGRRDDARLWAPIAASMGLVIWLTTVDTDSDDGDGGGWDDDPDPDPEPSPPGGVEIPTPGDTVTSPRADPTGLVVTDLLALWALTDAPQGVDAP